MIIWSRWHVSSIVYLAAAVVSTVSAYGAFSGEELTAYDITSGVANVVSTVLWLGACSYDIYLTFVIKKEQRSKLDIEESDEENEMDKQKQLSYQNILQKIKIIESKEVKIPIKLPEARNKVLKLSFIDENDKKQTAIIPLLRFKIKKNKSEQNNNIVASV